MELQQVSVQGVVSLETCDEDLILSGMETQVQAQTADMLQSLSETQHTINLTTVVLLQQINWITLCSLIFKA